MVAQEQIAVDDPRRPDVLVLLDRHRKLALELARLVDQGQLRPQVGAVHPLAEAAKAFTAKATGGIPGRVVLQP